MIVMLSVCHRGQDHVGSKHKAGIDGLFASRQNFILGYRITLKSLRSQVHRRRKSAEYEKIVIVLYLQQLNIGVKFPQMRGHNHLIGDKQPLIRPLPVPLDIENQYTFENNSYIFPNDQDLCRKSKSFKTVLEMTNFELSDLHTKKLSTLNKSQHIIKLKQIKREELGYDLKHTGSRYLLYYEAIPYSMTYVKTQENPQTVASHHLEKILKEVADDLIEFNILCEVTPHLCGFNEQGEFKVFIPPLLVLSDKKLTSTQKLKIQNSLGSVLKFWQSDKSRILDQSPPNQIRRSYRYNSPQLRKQPAAQTSKALRSSQDENIDIKKTIKLSKNYVKELNDKLHEDASKNEKRCELKKHRSLGLITKQDEKQVPVRKGSNFLTKIDQLNKKLSIIRQAFITKKSTDHPRESLQNFISREKIRHSGYGYSSPPPRLEENYEQQIIFEKNQDGKVNLLQNNVEQYRSYDFDNQSVDTYLQEIGHEYKMPKFSPNNQLRKTTLPTEILSIKNALNAREPSNWHHESAGNLVFKRFIQRTKQVCPQFGAQKSHASLSKISLPKNKQIRQSVKQVKKQYRSPLRVKKMISLDTFECKAQTKSVNLSEFSNDLSNIKKQKEKEEKSKHMKQKIQDILLKSKKAIEQLKNPAAKKRK